MDPIRTLSEQCNEVVSELDYREANIVGVSNGIARAATLQEEATSVSCEHAVAELKSRSGPTVVQDPCVQRAGCLTCLRAAVWKLWHRSGCQVEHACRFFSWLSFGREHLKLVANIFPYQESLTSRNFCVSHDATIHAAQYTLIVGHRTQGACILHFQHLSDACAAPSAAPGSEGSERGQETREGHPRAAAVSQERRASRMTTALRLHDATNASLSLFQLLGGPPWDQRVVWPGGVRAPRTFW